METNQLLEKLIHLYDEKIYKNLIVYKKNI